MLNDYHFQRTRWTFKGFDFSFFLCGNLLFSQSIQLTKQTNPWKNKSPMRRPPGPHRDITDWPNRWTPKQQKQPQEKRYVINHIREKDNRKKWMKSEKWYQIVKIPWKQKRTWINPQKKQITKLERTTSSTTAINVFV